MVAFWDLERGGGGWRRLRPPLDLPLIHSTVRGSTSDTESVPTSNSKVDLCAIIVKDYYSLGALENQFFSIFYSRLRSCYNRFGNLL